MKTAERHRLKTNEIATGVAELATYWHTHKKTVMLAAVAAVVALAALAGVLAWRQRTAERASAALAEAMSIAAAPAGASAPGTVPTANTYATVETRDKAALDKLLAVASSFPSTKSGIAARYQAASLLARQGRTADAQREFDAVATAAGRGIYGRMARLGIAELQVQAGQYDPAIATFRDMLARNDADLPADGLLMQLGRAYLLAGKRAEARQTLTRLVDEHPQSLYVADARRELDTLKAGSAS